MDVSRRHVLALGGAAIAASHLSRFAEAAGAVEVVMRGDTLGSEVWFDPKGLLVGPGTTVTWRNDDRANSHTATAFHPANRDHPLRIPVGAEPWNSDYLLPGMTFAVTLTVPGVYDYFCIPHEMAGMVGRIVVMAPGAGATPLPEGEVDGRFPPVAEIVRLGAVAGS
jgi:plastocyanin